MSIITDDDKKEMVAQNQMFLKLLFEQQAERKEEHTRILMELNYMRRTERNETTNLSNWKIFKMVDPVQYCGGAQEIDKFLQSLRWNFDGHKHLFPKGCCYRVKYGISFRDT
jgi:hypothetical protein